MTITHAPVLKHDLDRLLAEYGLRRVLATLITALVTRRRMRRARPPDATELSHHLRRDVGLLEPPHSTTHYLEFALKSAR